MAAVSSGSAISVLATAVFFGAATYPIFSVSIAHANDFCTPDDRVSLNATLFVFYAVGAIFSPIVASALIGVYGPFALFAFVSVAHGFLLVFGLSRTRARATNPTRTRYKYVPRTSFIINRLLKRRK